MGLQPLGGRVVVTPNEEKERVEGGIVLPESVSEKPTQGTVIAVGPGEMLDTGKRAEMPVKVGDVVIYGKYSGMEITIDGTDYKILTVNDILAVRE
ncbi:MAG: co-chaperone GroES [Armatimonadetes bacterium]|nr:co-chaperone GroES [Armatimonadota bacterium]